MAIDEPETQYAQSGDVHIAYKVAGDGELDVVLVLGFAQHVDLAWEQPNMARFFRGLASFSRLIVFDKRGTGLSDRSVGVPTLEERMDDIRAVMDAAGSQRAVLMGVSEGAPTCVLFAATYPDRTSALVLFGGMARSTEAPDYPWAAPASSLIEAGIELIQPNTYSGGDLEIWAPSVADNEEAQRAAGRYRRSTVSPDGLVSLFLMFLDIDVRGVLPSVSVPTLVMHRRGDRAVNRRAGEWMASQIEGARYLELPGQDHFPWIGDVDTVVDETREFLTGVRHGPEPARVLATVVFTDIVSSTAKAAELGDRRWHDLLDDHDRISRNHVQQQRGRVIKTTGDGMLASFDGPARAVRAAQGIRDAVRPLGLEIRCGIHTGEVELRTDDLAGMAVVIAERVSGLGNAGEVLVSSTVKDLVVGSGLEFEPHGEHELKGVPDRWRLFRALP